MTGANVPAERMPLVGALQVLRDARGDTDVVITTMGSAREWMRLGDLHPLDMVLVPSSMGHGTSMGLGLAIARPDRRVITCMGDGSMLMNLGSLVSIVAAGVENLVVIVFDNGVYEVTGLQPTAGAAAARGGRRPVDFGEIARASGFEAVYRLRDLDDWRRDARRLLAALGPTFIALDVEPVVGGTAPHSPGPAAERARRFMAALGAPSQE
ncbi:MAG: thiamine pyrophosphate TPP-binding protein [Geminicoccaceae bacterium]|nr:thiamine pyrophosphate TPP-binding protein [Geminicoccaceae bacterium]